MATDLKLVRVATAENPHVGDLEVRGTEFVLVQGAEALAQEVEVRLRWWRGEHFLDVRRGTPWLEQILRKGVDIAAVHAVLEEQILATQGVVAVREWNLRVDHNRRVLSGTVEIVTEAGPATVTVGEG